MINCVNGKCTRAVQMGGSCTRPNENSECDFSPSGGGLSCLKSESGALKCLMQAFNDNEPCGDSIGTGCDAPGSRCIKGYCGVPSGGKGDVCGADSTCKPGLPCLKSPISGAGSRCMARGDTGFRCDPNEMFVSCRDGLKCVSTSIGMLCLGALVPIGGKCTLFGSVVCASGLTCIASKASERELGGAQGTCQQVLELGGACNPAKFQICNRTINDLTVNLPQLECKNGKCATKTVGTSGDRCGAGTGAICAPRDAIAKLQCVSNICVHFDVPIGQRCLLPNRFVPEEKCASNLRCLVFDPDAQTKCARLGRDGDQCDYNKFAGCQGSARAVLVDSARVLDVRVGTGLSTRALRELFP
jgi:hypothetical protein